MFFPHAFTTARLLGRVLLDLAGELLAPTECAACDDPMVSRATLCPACAATLQAPARRFRGGSTLAAFAYGGALATAITRFKYQGRPELARRLAPAMSALVAGGRGTFDVVVPVPLHPRRLADRGYNQAALLARRVARDLDVPFAPRLLERARDTAQQANLDRATRLVNLAGAFRVRDPEVLARRPRVLLIDDVRTTGATLEGCTAALRMVAGVGKVVALVLAAREEAP